MSDNNDEKAPKGGSKVNQAELPVTEKAKPAAKEPTVKLNPEFAAGQKVKHANGHIYTVRDVLPDGVRLEGVANLVDVVALEPIEE